MRLTVRQRPANKLKLFGIADQLQRKGYRDKPLSTEDKRRNEAIAVIRAGGERPFATYKSRYGLARTRFMRLAKNMTAYGIEAIAQNLRKGAKFWPYTEVSVCKKEISAERFLDAIHRSLP